MRRDFDEQYGFGIEISHSRGIYPEKRVFFKNEEMLGEWMDLLRFYRGESVQQKYEIGQKIGTGKFSVVYKCRHLEEGVEYALKEIATYKLDQTARQLIAYASLTQARVEHHAGDIASTPARVQGVSAEHHPHLHRD